MPMSSTAGGGAAGAGFAAGLAPAFTAGAGFFFAVAAGRAAGFVSAASAPNDSAPAAKQATR